MTAIRASSHHAPKKEPDGGADLGAAFIADQKPRFVTLDGLRGVAALCVVLLHGGSVFGISQLFPQASLAVDFFFVLSGFVIASAYEQRLQTSMSYIDYVRRRLIRLYPMTFLGAALGALYWFVVGGREGVSGAAALMIFALAAVALPFWGTLPIGGGYFPANPPGWSLTFEIAANLAYGFCVKFLKGRVLAFVILVAWAPLAFGIYKSPYLNMGFIGDQFWINIPRTVFSFCIGVALFRSRQILRLKVSPVILVLILAATFLPNYLPQMWIYKLFCITAVYPLIVLSGSFCVNEGRYFWLFELSGALSYPIYLLHWPTILWLTWLEKHTHVSFSPMINMLILIVVTIGLAGIVLRIYDQPVRKTLAALA